MRKLIITLSGETDKQILKISLSDFLVPEREVIIVMEQVSNSKSRKGCVDVWNAFMADGAKFSVNDIPLCPTTVTALPEDIVDWEEAKAIYKQNTSSGNTDFYCNAFVCFYLDDYKFDGVHGIWHDSKRALEILRHFAGVITPDFSTYQDFPEPLKIYATYRMRLIGYWLGKNGIGVINNIRWGTSETYRYCFDGIPTDSVVAIGTVGGSPRKLVDRKRFEDGFYVMVKKLKPHTIVVYGSANFPCFEWARSIGIKVISFESRTCRAHKRGDAA